MSVFNRVASLVVLNAYCFPTGRALTLLFSVLRAYYTYIRKTSYYTSNPATFFAPLRPLRWEVC